MILLSSIVGIVLGGLYAQLFLYHKRPRGNIRTSWQQLLVQITSSTVIRVGLLVLIFASLLSWPQINLILVLILFLATFWLSLLKNLMR